MHPKNACARTSVGKHALTRRALALATVLAACGPAVDDTSALASATSSAGHADDHPDDAVSESSAVPDDNGTPFDDEPFEDETPPTGLGAACEHGWFGMNANLLTHPHPGCDGDICIFATDELPPAGDCSADVDCGPHHQCAAREDGAHRCVLKLSYVLERSMCSQVCEVDDDCVAEADTHCEQGFTCSRFAGLGPLCCQRVCVCRDDFDFTGALDQDCEDGTAPGCCRLDDPPPGCGAP